MQCNLGDSNDDRNSSFAPLIIHGIALANVSGAAYPHTHARTHACIQMHMVVELAARGYTHVGGTRVCAQMSASGRSLERRFTNICMGKKNHPSRSRPSGVGSGGRTMFWASFLYGRARHKIDERL